MHLCVVVDSALPPGTSRLSFPHSPSAAPELRTIRAHERDAVLDLLAEWLDDRAFFARYFSYDPTFRDDLCFVAVDEGRIVSTLQVFRKRLRAAGAILDVGGVANVYTAAGYRSRGLASALLRRACAAMESHFFDVSLLFSDRVEFYGRLGWRSLLRHLAFLEPAIAHPPRSCQIVPFAADRDLGTVMRLYATYSGSLAGTTLRDRAYWEGQIRYAGNPEERFVLANVDDCPVAYARGTTLYGFPAITEHACLPEHEEALADLFCHLHAGGDPSRGSLAQLATSARLESQLRKRGLTVRSIEDSSWMWRTINRRRLAEKLAATDEELDSPDFFGRLFPKASSVYWLADRF